MGMARRGVILVGCATLAAMSLTACQGKSQAQDGSSGGGKGLTIGYSTYTLSNPFFAGMLKGLKTGAAKAGYQLISTNANGDPAQQVTDIQNLLSRGAKYILLTPADGKAIAPAVAAADHAHVPVISIADSVQPPIASTIQVDDEKAGQQAADQIAGFLKKKNGTPRGDVVDIEGLSGTPAASKREAGFRAELKNYPDIKVVAAQDGGFDTGKANSLMTDILQAHSDVSAVFAANDAMAVGVESAIKSQGRFVPVGKPGHIYVIGVDGSKPSIDAIRAGVQDASISQNPIKMAEKAVATVQELAKGGKVPTVVHWPAQLITRENIDSAAVKAYGIWADEV
jgi:ABC-type sugar transport system substrate-binding protein